MNNAPNFSQSLRLSEEKLKTSTIEQDIGVLRYWLESGEGEKQSRLDVLDAIERKVRVLLKTIEEDTDETDKI